MQELDNILQNSTANITREYYQLPIDGKEDPVYRERVYCYELYHQMRVVWPENSQYTLSGEVDKSGHPLIRGNGLNNTKPDFLIHIPGYMAGNFAIIEVKPINASRGGVIKDLETLTAYCRHAGYERAIYLIYGEDSIDRIMGIIKTAPDENKKIDVSIIELWFHSTVGEPASRII